jgi:hypothetical protein
LQCHYTIALEQLDRILEIVGPFGKMTSAILGCLTKHGSMNQLFGNKEYRT